MFLIPNIELNAVQIVEFSRAVQNKNENKLVKRAEPVKVSAASKYLYRGEGEPIHSLTGVHEVREKYGLTGKGVRVAVVDTGVDYMHPALGGGFGKGYPVAYGYDLVGDDFHSGEFLNSVPDDDPIDNCSLDSHGTHVAGIIAADSSRVQNISMQPPLPLTGAAPGVEIGAYRIFGCSGSTATDILAAAIYAAAYNGSHIINLSVGGAPAHADSIDSVACEDVGKLGHFCVTAAGNQGTNGTYTVSEPGNSRGGFGIGSVVNSAIVTNGYIIIDGEAYFATFGDRKFPARLSLTGIVVSNKNAETKNVLNDGVQVTENVKGKIVLVRWGPPEIAGSYDRCEGVFKKGGIACILYAYNSEISYIIGSDHIPSAFLERSAGLKLRSLINSGRKVNAVIDSKKEVWMNVVSFGGGTVSDFSSTGLDIELFIKPDVSAIGENVYSTISRVAAESNDNSTYAFYSGTSMATPNFAGILALYLESKISNNETFGDFETLKARFQTTANPVMVYQTVDKDSVAKQGSGLVNIYRALALKTRVFPGSISLNDTARMETSYLITVYNDGDGAASYSLSHEGARMISPFAAGDDAIQNQENSPSTNTHASVKFRETSFTLEPYTSKEVTVNFTGPSTKKKWPIFSGFLVVSNDRNETLQVPYAGVLGNWTNAPVFVRQSPFMNKAFNAKVTTGVFNNQLKKVPKVNVVYGAVILPAIVQSTRNAVIDFVPNGIDESEFTALGLDPKNLPSPFLYTLDGLYVGHFTGAAIRNIPGRPQYAWFGEVGYDFTLLPAGKYTVKFYALKNFGETASDGDIDSTDVSQFDVKIIK